MFSNRATILEVNLDNIAYNIKQFKNIARNSELMAVVKADAYGHGAVKVANTAIKSGATWLGVATVREGVELRKAGLRVPILVLGGISPEEIIDCYKNNIDISIHSKNFIKQIDRYKVLFTNPLNVHIKIDTGMHRIGILPADLQQFISELKEIEYLKVRGISTHLSNAAGNYESSYRQIDCFTDCVNMAESKLGPIPYKHIANSAAIIKLPQSHFNLVRAGLGLYGYHDDIELYNYVDLKTAITLKTKIISIREITAGEKVGYGGTYTASKDAVIATIPIGYADGYNRLLSNRGMVLIHGIRAKIVGRICMDQSMIDVSNIQGVAEGDEVVVIGKQGLREITVYEICKWINSIPNEVLTSIKSRVEKKYITTI